MNYQILTGYLLLLISTGAVAAPVVSGSTIKWPDDGWYQVQAVENGIYKEVCSGGRSCEVAAGEYVVINHTTGERFSNIWVSSGGAAGGSVGNVTVTGNTISWPDDGWYQVQRADTYEDVCQGGTSCEVANGVYHVINLSNNTRNENVRVGGDVKSRNVNASPSTAVTSNPSQGIIAQVGYATLLRESLAVMRGSWLENVIAWSENELNFLPNPDSARSTSDVKQFNCPASGSVTRDLRVNASNNSQQSILNFSNCSTSSVTANGVLELMSEYSSDDQSTTKSNEWTFVNLKLRQNNGNEISIESGIARRDNLTVPNPFCANSPGKQGILAFHVSNVSLLEGGRRTSISSSEYAGSTGTYSFYDQNKSECYGPVKQFYETGTALAHLASAPNTGARLQTNDVIVTRGSRDDSTGPSRGSHRVELGDGERLQITMIEDDNRTAQVDLDSGGTSTSGVQAFNFFPGN